MKSTLSNVVSSVKRKKNTDDALLTLLLSALTNEFVKSQIYLRSSVEDADKPGKDIPGLTNTVKKRAKCRS